MAQSRAGQFTSTSSIFRAYSFILTPDRARQTNRRQSQCAGLTEKQLETLAVWVLFECLVLDASQRIINLILQMHSSSVFRRTCGKHGTLSMELNSVTHALIIICRKIPEQIFLKAIFAANGWLGLWLNVNCQRDISAWILKVVLYPPEEVHLNPVRHLIWNPFSANVPIMDKPGSWSLLAKCLKKTCGRVTF